jgi:hypothetical protein
MKRRLGSSGSPHRAGEELGNPGASVSRSRPMAVLLSAEGPRVNHDLRRDSSPSYRCLPSRWLPVADARELSIDLRTTASRRVTHRSSSPTRSCASRDGAPMPGVRSLQIDPEQARRRRTLRGTRICACIAEKVRNPTQERTSGRRVDATTLLPPWGAGGPFQLIVHLRRRIAAVTHGLFRCRNARIPPGHRTASTR